MRQFESFFWGAVAALGALVLQVVVLIITSVLHDPFGGVTTLAYLTTAWGIVGAAFIEELFKYIIIAKRIDSYSLEKTFIINSLFVGCGFFFVELVLLYMKNAPIIENIPQLSQIGIVHMTTAGIIGYRIATRNPNKISTIVSTLLLVTIIHSAYNLLVNYPNPLTEILILMLLGILLFTTFFNFFHISRKLAA